MNSSTSEFIYEFIVVTGKVPDHLEGWDVLYNHPECYLTKFECYITILEMLYNNCYITHVIKHDKYKVI